MKWCASKIVCNSETCREPTGKNWLGFEVSKLKQCFQMDFFSPALVASLLAPANPFVDQDTSLLRIMRLTVRVWQTILTLSFFFYKLAFLPNAVWKYQMNSDKWFDCSQILMVNAGWRWWCTLQFFYFKPCQWTSIQISIVQCTHCQ